MRSKLFFRENGTVIHTRSPLRDRLQSWALALLVAVVVLVLPGLLDPLPLDDDTANTVPWADHLAELEAQYLAQQQRAAQMAVQAYDVGVQDGRLQAATQCPAGRAGARL